MNLQKMYAIGQTIYVDMDTWHKRKTRLSLHDKHGNLLSDSKCSDQRRVAIGGVLKSNVAASRQKSLEVYEYGVR
jgi:hypothetical protein